MIQGLGPPPTMVWSQSLSVPSTHGMVPGPVGPPPPYDSSMSSSQYEYYQNGYVYTIQSMGNFLSVLPNLLTVHFVHGSGGAIFVCRIFSQISMLQMNLFFSRRDKVLIPFKNGIGEISVHTTVHFLNARNHYSSKKWENNPQSELVFYRVAIHF